MLFFFSLIPATLAVIIGYFVLFASTRSEGGMKRFGQFLAIWMFFLAGVVVLAGLIAPAMGVRGPMSGMFQHMETMEQQQEEILRELQQD